MLGAKPGRRIVLNIDDVNMPAKEFYGAQPPIELLRLLCDRNGLYDRKDLYWKVVKDVLMVCSAAPPGGGRNDLSQRFTRHFTLISVPQASQETLKRIFEPILAGFFAANNFPEVVKVLAPETTRATIELYLKISKEKLPTPSRFHYTFNLRDISKVI